MMLDLLFPVQGNSVSTDHAYQHYSAISKLIPLFPHQRSAENCAATVAIDPERI